MDCAFVERPKPCGDCTLCQLRAALEEVARLKAAATASFERGLEAAAAHCEAYAVAPAQNDSFDRQAAADELADQIRLIKEPTV